MPSPMNDIKHTNDMVFDPIKNEIVGESAQRQHPYASHFRVVCRIKDTTLRQGRDASERLLHRFEHVLGSSGIISRDVRIDT